MNCLTEKATQCGMLFQIQIRKTRKEGYIFLVYPFLVDCNGKHKIAVGVGGPVKMVVKVVGVHIGN